jgi:zinc/manganese transport system substrate-binding protein
MRQLIVVAAACAAMLIAPAAWATVNVFACEPEWAALTQEIGGDKVSVYQATTAQQDPHHIQARPSLIARTRVADLLVCTGAELEIGWLPLLVRTSGNDKLQAGQPGYFLAADFVPKLEIPTRLDRAEGDVHALGNPHIQLDPRNIARVASPLAERLGKIDPANAAYYQERLKAFGARWQKAITEWEVRAAPLKGMKLVPYHKDEIYLINWLGMDEEANLEPKPGVPPSAGHLAELLAKLKGEPANAITRTPYQDPKPGEWLSERTNIPAIMLPYTVGGTPGAKDLFSLFDETISRLLQAKTRT